LRDAYSEKQKRNTQACPERSRRNDIRNPRICVLGAPRRLIGHDCRETQLMQAGISADKITETAKEMFEIRNPKSEIHPS